MLHQEVWCTLEPSKIHGIGVIAIRDIPARTSLFDGEKNDTLYRIPTEVFKNLLPAIQSIVLKSHLQTNSEYIWFKHPNRLAMMQCFMNHSEQPNSDGHIALVDIKCGEEVTEDYNRLTGGRLLEMQRTYFQFLPKLRTNI